MKHSIILFVAVLLIGGLSGYIVSSTGIFSAGGSSNQQESSGVTLLDPVNQVPDPNSPNDPSLRENKPDEPIERVELPPESNPTPTPSAIEVSPGYILANRDNFSGQQVNVFGTITKEVIADMSEPAENHLTSMKLVDRNNTDRWLTLKNSDGEYVECDGNVDTCMGFTDGKYVTLSGTIELIGFSSAVLTID